MSTNQLDINDIKAILIAKKNNLTKTNNKEKLRIKPKNKE